MSKIVCTSIGLLLSFFSYGQFIQFKDIESQEPIEDLAIFNEDKSKSVLTSTDGVADISMFSSDEILFIQHPSYQIITFKKSLLSEKIIFLEKKVIELEEFVISAYRWEQNKNEIPNKITRLSHAEIKFMNPQTTADLIENTEEVFIQKSQLGGGSPMIRGFSTNTVLLVVDGVRMNNAIFREGNLQNIISLDANAIENSEVIFGPGSVTYGSDALGGVMDFHTLQPKLSTSEEKYFSANALARFSSANIEKTGHLDFNIGTQKWAFLSSISYSNYDDLRMGANNHDEYQRPEYVDQIDGRDSIFTNEYPNVQVESGYSQINVMQKVRYRPNQKTDLTYAFHYSELSDVPRYDRLIQYSGDQLKYGEWYYGPQKWMMHQFVYNYSKSTSLFDHLKLNTAFQHYEESRHDRRFQSNLLSESFEKVDAYCLNLDFDKDLKRDNQLYYGIEVVYNDVNSTAHEKDVETGTTEAIQSRYPDGENRYTTLAAYLSYKENFNDKLSGIGGIRANYVSLYSTLEDTAFFNFPFDEISVNSSALNGSLGLVYKPTTKWQFNLNLSSGFHAPNIDDMAKIFDPEPQTIVVPNSNLKPEYAYNIDLGVQKVFWKKFTFNMTGFYTYLTNAFVRRESTFNEQDSIMYKGELSQVLSIVNADKAYIYGFSSSIRIDFTNNILFKSVINYTHGEDQDGVTLRHAAPMFGSTELSYSKNRLKASVYAKYNGKIEYENLAPSEQGKPYLYATDENGNPYSPAWWTLNIMTSYLINNWADLHIGMENILDTRYRPYSSGIVAPGRNFKASLRLHF